MTHLEIFRNAPEKATPEEFAAYLDDACAGDDELRAKVEALSAKKERGEHHLDEQLAPTRAASILMQNLLDSDSSSETEAESLIGKQLTHYQVLDTLGRGGMGVVYGALDTRLGRTVALKILHPEIADDPDLRQRFEREARAVAALAHPNICKIFDIGEEDGVPFLVMEFIDGKCLSERISIEPREIDELVLIGNQIAEALAAAHAGGIVHRDIKPGNIFLTDDDVVTVLDFGLAKFEPNASAEGASDSTFTELTSIGQIIGTIAFMSPEQAKGDPIGPATDVFSLGTLLYKMATGTYPFTGNSKVEILNAIITNDPVAPSTLNAKIPRDLDSVILQMLQKNSELRPDATTVAKALRSISTSADSSASALSSSVQGQRHPVVGRENELAMLVNTFKGVSANKGQLVCLTGEPGIGKTTLANTFLEQVETGEGLCAVARGRCSERLVGTEAFLPLLEALENLCRAYQNAAHQMQLLAPSWYAQISTAISRETASEQPAEPVMPASQEQMKRELAAFFQELSRLRPVILFIDDVHWADASTTDLLAYLAARFDTLGLMIVLTYRPTDLRLAEHPFLKVKMELEAKGLAKEIPLPFLGYEDLGGYLDQTFPGHGFPKEFMELVYSKTEGNPLFMVDLMHYLRDRGALAEVDGRWMLTVSLEDIEGDLPVSVRSLIQLKIERLDNADRRLLAAASVQGQTCDSAVLARALDADPVDVEERLEALDKIHALVKSAGEEEFPDGTLTVRFGFVHALYQNAFYGSLSPARRSSLSAVVAAALCQFYDDRSEEVAYELAFLYEGARDFARATEFFRLAAENNLKVYAYREAAQLAQRGLGLVSNLPTDTERIEQELMLQLVLGPALMPVMGFAAPDVEETYSRVRELSQRIEAKPQLFFAILGLWQFHQIRGELSQALAGATELLELALSVGDTGLQIEACRMMGETLIWKGEVTPAREYLERGIELLRDAPPGQLTGLPVAATVACHAWLAWSLTVLGFPEQAREAVKKTVTLAGDRPFSLAYAHIAGCIVRCILAEPDRVLEHAKVTVELSQEHGFPLWLGIGVTFESWALVLEGGGEEQLARLRHSIEVTRQTGAGLMVPWQNIQLTEATRAAGNLDEALQVIEESIAAIREIGVDIVLAEAHLVKGELLAAQSKKQAPEAEASFREAIEVARSQGARWWELRASLELARLLHLQNRSQEAREALSGIYGSFTEGFDTLPLREAKELLEELA